MCVCLRISMHDAYTQMSVLKFKPFPPPPSPPPLPPLSYPCHTLSRTFIFLLRITSQRTRISLSTD
jgi:hypothetical protein